MQFNKKNYIKFIFNLGFAFKQKVFEIKYIKIIIFNMQNC